MSDKIFVFDTTLRDGEQVPGCQLNTVEKIEVARVLEEMGVDVLEAGFPISSPGDFNSVVEISKAVRKPTICALTRAVEKDIDCASEALKFAEKGRIHTGIGASDMHVINKLKSTHEKILERAAYHTKYARNLIDDVEFYCEDAGRADLAFLAKMVETVIANGATVVNIPDTTGYCLPDEYGQRIKYLYDHVSNIDQAIISVHCHNDLGMATANTIAGVRNGARQIEVTVNGIGERAGNTSLEEAVMVIKSHKNLNVHTDIDIKRIYPVSRLITRLMSMPVQPNKAIVGRNAFAHSSGIHQDGVLKNRENYEIIDPHSVGIPESSIILTARSGRAALKYNYDKLGVELTKEELDATYDKFLELADRKKNFTDDDLLALVGVEAKEANIVEIVDLKVTCGTAEIRTAELTILMNGVVKTASAEGNGPVDATLKAIDKIIQKPVVVEEYLVQLITGGSDDQGKVHYQISKNGVFFYGFGTNTDIVLASAQAYLDALEKVPN